jgi:lipopolysaccharide transport system ATP-binding protein
MTDVAIRAESLGKQFHIGELQHGYKSFREVTVETLFGPFRRLQRLLRGQTAGAADLNDTVWALRDVGFEIHQGEVVGIIGSNGAGKSTLLKILSRITEPTQGFADVHGRVGSLLEVGTGFHQELTGRENIYLNGAILGMRKVEIDRKFDEIVAFAEVDRFLDTPVKHYSTGMQTRLGFAVAAHLDAEILLVDEVLAVGDAAFQRKCLGQMQDVAKGGRTVVFVSHNMGSITQLCERVLWLDHGQLRLAGEPDDVVKQYLSAGTQTASIWIPTDSSPSSTEVAVRRVRVLAAGGAPSSIIDFDSSFSIEIAYELMSPIRHLAVAYYLFDAQGNMLWSSRDLDPGDWNGRVRDAGMYISTCRVPGQLLRPGRYFLTVACFRPTGRYFAYHRNILHFEITGVGCQFDLNRPGLTTPRLEWTVEECTQSASLAP